jgi:hypothetical protein
MQRGGVVVAAFTFSLALGPGRSTRLPAAQADFIRGDIDQNRQLEITDVFRVLDYLFLSGKVPPCLEAVDANDDGQIDIADASYLLNFLFLGGDPIPEPYPDCGPDPTGDSLGCESSCNGPPLTAPILYDLGPDDDHLSPGQEITLRGVNFSSQAEANRVLFQSGVISIPGQVERVEFPSDGNPANGLESVLKVLVPTGVASGNVTLEVEGTFAGAAACSAGPQVFSFGIGTTGRQPALIHSGLQGFDPQVPPITVLLFGLNFEDIDRILVTDSSGSQVEVPRSNWTRQAPPGKPPNQLQVIGFSLQGAPLAIRTGQRDSIAVQVTTPFSRSNIVQVPVVDISGADPERPALGAVINGIVAPPGVRTGPLRLRYSVHDDPLIDQAFTLDVKWTADGGSTWHPAVPDRADPQHDGEANLLPGAMAFGSPAGLLFAGGALRTFAWDARNDPDFRALTQAPGGAPRSFALRFRLHPIPEGTVAGKPGDLGHFIESPPIAYLDLEDRAGQDFSKERTGELVEDFLTAEGEDPGCTTASWGPPLNPGRLVGVLPADPPPASGRGLVDLVLQRADPPPANLIREFFLADTDSPRIDHVITVNDTTQTPPVPRTTVETVFPTPAGANPGQGALEFHLRTLVVESKVEVHLEGGHPAIFRISGSGLDETAVTVRIRGIVEADGDPGESPAIGGPPGGGGSGRCGGGAGGRGAALAVDGAGRVLGLIQAQAGGNDGGGGGATAAAIDPDLSQISRFVGAPGGGAGNFGEGGAGDPGVPSHPDRFAFPRGGAAGPRRGSARQAPLPAGSGGGGGGATAYRPLGGAVIARNGAGGGGGGGSIQITARGGMAISGAIRAHGGQGGDGLDSGAGGGGSGGSILLQSTGAIAVACTALDVDGGESGDLFGQNRLPGAGDGGPGWIRIEPGAEPAQGWPACAGASFSIFQPGASRSSGCSRAFALGLSTGGAALSHGLVPGDPIVEILPIEGTGAFLSIRGAAPSLDVHGLAGPFRGGVEAPKDLQELEFVQFSVELLSNVSGGAAQVNRIALPFRMP